MPFQLQLNASISLVVRVFLCSACLVMLLISSRDSTMFPWGRSTYEVISLKRPCQYQQIFQLTESGIFPNSLHNFSTSAKQL